MTLLTVITEPDEEEGADEEGEARVGEDEGEDEEEDEDGSTMEEEPEMEPWRRNDNGVSTNCLFPPRGFFQGYRHHADYGRSGGA